MCRPEEELGFAPTSTTTANNSNNNAPPSSRSRSTNSFSGYASDLWSASASLYIFASGRLPSHSDSPIELFPMIYDAHVPYYTTNTKRTTEMNHQTMSLTTMLEHSPLPKRKAVKIVEEAAVANARIHNNSVLLPSPCFPKSSRICYPRSWNEIRIRGRV